MPVGIFTLALACGVAGPAPRLAVIRAAPEFTLVTQDGGTLRLADLRGTVVVVSFVFTTCNGTCPATTHRLSQIQEELKRRRLFRGGRVRLLSITLDPARDTPEVLRNYMRIYDADPAVWTFLSGTTESISRAIHAWGMWVRPTANGQLDHPSRIFLLDRRSRIREIYSLSFLRAPWVAEDVADLLGEHE